MSLRGIERRTTLASPVPFRFANTKSNTSQNHNTESWSCLSKMETAQLNFICTPAFRPGRQQHMQLHLKSKAGQLRCSSRSSLALCSTLNKTCAGV